MDILLHKVNACPLLPGRISSRSANGQEETEGCLVAQRLLLFTAGEELHLSAFNGQLDPSVGQLAEGFVSLQAHLKLIDTVGPNKAADFLASMNIEEFAVWPVSLGLVWILALASFLSADLVLV